MGVQLVWGSVYVCGQIAYYVLLLRLRESFDVLHLMTFNEMKTTAPGYICHAVMNGILDACIRGN